MALWLQLCIRGLLLIYLVICHSELLISVVAVPGIVHDDGNAAGLTLFTSVLIFLVMEIEQGLRNVGF
jgi:hypothetical protein